MTFTKPQMKNEIEKAVYKYMTFYYKYMLNSTGSTTVFSKRFVLYFDLKGLSAGQCWSVGKIRFNMDLAMTDQDKFLITTVPHEIAHWIVFNTCKNAKPHGKEWKNIMSLFGVPIQRCHTYDTLVVATNRHSYTCKCGISHLVGIRMHNIIQKNLNSRVCSKCKSELTYDGVNKKKIMEKI